LPVLYFRDPNAEAESKCICGFAFDPSAPAVSQGEGKLYPFFSNSARVRRYATLLLDWSGEAELE